MKTIQTMLTHLSFIIASIFITFLILDSYNPTMEFVSNSTSTKLLWVFCIITMVNSAIAILKKQ